MCDFEGTKKTEATPLRIHNGETSQIILVNQLDSVVNGGRRFDEDDLGLHHVVNAWREIGDEQRGGEAEFLEDKINPLVGVSTTGSHDIGMTGEVLKFCVTNCCADRIHVWIPMTDDDGLHVGEKPYRKGPKGLKLEKPQGKCSWREFTF